MKIEAMHYFLYEQPDSLTIIIQQQYIPSSYQLQTPCSSLNHRLGPLALCDDRNSQAPVWALQNELLMAARP